MVVTELTNEKITNAKQGFFQKIITAMNKIHLRTELIVPFVLQIFGTVSLVAYLSFKKSEAAVNEVVCELRNEVSNRIQLNLSNSLKSANLINSNIEQILRGDMFNINQPDKFFF